MIPGMAWTLTVKDLGPFKDASIEVRPLTVIIGRNSSGKSLLLRLMWALSTSGPDDELFIKYLSEKVGSEKAWELLRTRFSARNALVNLREIEGYTKLYADIVIRSFLDSTRNRVKEVLGDIGGEVRISSGQVSITIDLFSDKNQSVTPKLEDLIEVTITEKIGVGIRFKGSKSLLEGLPPEMIIGLGDGDLYSIILTLLETLVGRSGPFFKASGITPVIFLVDSRAGLMKYKLPALLKIYDLSDIILKNFIDQYFILLEEFDRGEIQIPEEFLNELGFTLKVVDEGGFKVPYVQLWNGKVFPLSEVPSGIREALPIALALGRDNPSIVYIEEPEAHLHPRAQRIVAKMIANAVKKGKYVIITTHSEFLLYTLSDVVGLYRKDKEAGLDPNMVSAYLLKRGDRYTEVEKLTVDEYGISEEEFGKVAEEMLDERGKIYD